MQNRFPLIKQHLQDVNESYFVHMRHAFYFCRNCFAAFLALLVHCIIPSCFVTTGSSIIGKLHKIMSVRAEVATIASSNDRHVAIVGFGLSGLLAFLDIVEKYQPSCGKLVIRIFEKSRFFSKGVAYSTKNINHLLNVSAYKMGVFYNDREHFFKWLVSKGYNYEKNDFVPRKIFGIYLEDVLELSLKIANEKGISYEFFNKEISAIEVKNKHYIIEGNAYNHCILSTGVRLKNWSQNFWHIELEKYLTQKEIHLKGCGLTAFDAIIALRDLNYDGTIFIHSRTGIMPQIHKIDHNLSQKVESPLTIEDSNLELSLIFKKFTKNCKNSQNWRVVFDAFRPMTQEFWKALSEDKKRRFLRHCFRLWNIHRHRCPPSQFEIIQGLLDSKKLIFEKKRSSEKNAIDCTGFDYGFKSRLIDSLTKNEIVKYDALNAGIISQNSNFYIMGGLNFGSSFEITAVPDITSQAQEIAEKIFKISND